ncbi:MAG: DNA/RNA nuclease SfsA [Betaproteobacteria bacterium]
MKFDRPLVSGRLIQRYKRFLADVSLDDGETITAHCPNTGSMLGCAVPGSRVWLTHAPSPTRKYAYGWELTQLDSGHCIGINTHRSNALVREALERARIALLDGYASLRPEVKYGHEASRADFLLQGAGRPDCYVEVKNVTAAVTDGVALFPDAVSERGTRHLREMMAMVGEGHRAVLVFCVQRADVGEVRPADAIDPAYGRTLRAALAAGVEATAWRADVAPDGIELRSEIPVHCP